MMKSAQKVPENGQVSFQTKPNFARYFWKSNNLKQKYLDQVLNLQPLPTPTLSQTSTSRPTLATASPLQINFS